MAQVEPTTAAGWKKKSQTGTWDVTVPSGNVAKLRRVNLETFIKLGIIPNSLLSIIREQIDDATKKGKGVQTGLDEEKLNLELGNLIADPERLAEVMNLADAVTVFTVVEPKVHDTPALDQERDDELLYVDEVDLEDKMFILQWALGGSSDVEQFRAQSTEDVGSVHIGEVVADSAQQPT